LREIQAAKRAAAAKVRADENYRAAVIAAAQVASYAEIAVAVGVSRQAIRQLVERSYA